MKILEEIIHKINSALGIAGRPHYIYVQGELIDSGCMEWSHSVSIAAQFSGMSPELQEAFRRFYVYMQQDDFDQAREALNDFFSREPLNIQREFADFIGNIEKVNSPYVIMPSLPQPSAELRTVLEGIQARLQVEFQDGDNFDINKYLERGKELLSLEPDQIQAEAKELGLEIQKIQSIYRNKKNKERLTLKNVRSLLRDDPVFAYTTNTEWDNVPAGGSLCIVVASTNDQFDALRIEHTNGTNYGLDTEDIIEKLKNLDERYGVDIVGANFDGLEFYLKQIPKGKEAKELGRWLLDFCPDLNEAPKSFRKGKVSLWWD
jgi:hypothetical protein